MSNEMIALLMFSSMMLMLLTGQRVFGAIGIVASRRSAESKARSGVSEASSKWMCR